MIPIARLPIALPAGGGIDKFNEIHFFSLFDHKRYVAIWNASNLDLGRVRNIYIYISDAIEPLYVNYSATCVAIIRGGQKQTDDVTPGGSIEGGGKSSRSNYRSLLDSREIALAILFFPNEFSLSPRARLELAAYQIRQRRIAHLTYLLTYLQMCN